MTGPHSETEDTKQISVAELLARNGSTGAPAAARRRRRRRGDSDSVTVAELTGEIPVIRDEPRSEGRRRQDTPPAAEPVNGRVEVAEAPAEPVAEPIAEPVAEPAAEPVTAAVPEAAVAPVVQPPADVAAEPVAQAPAAAPAPDVAEPVDAGSKPVYWAEPEPRWPKSEPWAARRTGPERSEYPRPLRHTGVSEAEHPDRQSGAEHMSPDPVGHYHDDESVDVMDSEVREADSAVEDSAFVRSYLSERESEHPAEPAFAQVSDGTLFGGQSIADEVARRRRGEGAPSAPDKSVQEPAPETGDRPRGGGLAAVGRGLVTLLQSVLAVAFGAGLFIAFDQLWRWNAIVALVLSVLVILGLVVGVRVVRKTEDIASTLIAVVVGLLITLGPMALLQSS